MMLRKFEDRREGWMLSHAEEERIRGSLIGMAVGVALGRGGAKALAEPPPTPAPTSSATSPEDLELPLRLAESYLEKRDLDVEDIASRWMAWLRSGPKDLGGVTREILLRAVRPRDLTRIAVQVREEKGHRMTAGNSGLVRTVPVALLRAGHVSLLEETARVCSLLQGDDICVQACQVFARALEVVILGGTGPEAIAAAEALAADLGPEVEGVIDSIRKSPRDSGFSGGYILNTLQMALRTMLVATEFGPGLQSVVDRQGDRDTNAAVTGALLGAVFRDGGIPPRWVLAVRDRARIEHVAHGLSSMRQT